MSGLATALAALGWLAGLVVLLRCPIVVPGCGLAALAWSWHPNACWATLAATAVASLVRRWFGPADRLLVLFPELAVALVAAVVALLAGGQVAAGALAVVALSLGWLVRGFLTETTETTPPRGGLGAGPAPQAQRWPAPVRGFLGVGALRVDAGQCPACGGVLIATGRTCHDPGRGLVFLAEANCMSCGQRLVGRREGSSSGPITWFDADEMRERSA